MPYEFRRFSVRTAGGCAWRARYFYLFGRVPRFYIGINPDHGNKPTLFGGWFINRGPIPYTKSRWRSGKFRLRLPSLRWQYQQKGVRKWAWWLSSRFWHQMDGRWGWFTPKRRNG